MFIKQKLQLFRAVVFVLSDRFCGHEFETRASPLIPIARTSGGVHCHFETLLLANIVCVFSFSARTKPILQRKIIYFSISVYNTHSRNI